MKSKYEPKTVEQALGYLVEECGEVLAAVGKAQRWGLESYNPEIPSEERETNRDWILRELKDLDGAVSRAFKFLTEHQHANEEPREGRWMRHTPEKYSGPDGSGRSSVMSSAQWRKYGEEHVKCVHLHERPNEDEDDGGPCLHVQLTVERVGDNFDFEADLRDALVYGSKSVKVARGYAYATEHHARQAADDQADRWRREHVRS